MKEINNKQDLIDATVELIEETEFFDHSDLTCLFDNIVEMFDVSDTPE